MRRPLIPTSAFTRDAKRHLRRYPRDADALETLLGKLEADAYDAALKTHKLKGPLADRLACGIGFDLRVTFRFVTQDGE